LLSICGGKLPSSRSREEPIITAEEFWLTQTRTPLLELVRGQPVPMRFCGGVHGGVKARVGTLLYEWADDSRGAVGISSGFVLARDPDTVRGPDVWFVRAERMRSSGVPEGFWEGAPDLAVEVVDFQNTELEMLGRVQDWLEGGTLLLWVVYPEREQIKVYGADGLVRTLEKGDTLESEAILPGFRCRVSEVFE